jgi:hypothetical protein
MRVYGGVEGQSRERSLRCMLESKLMDPKGSLDVKKNEEYFLYTWDRSPIPLFAVPTKLFWLYSAVRISKKKSINLCYVY